MAIFTEFATTLGRFLDPLSLFVVFGGSLVASAVRSTRGDIRRAIVALRPLLFANPEQEAQAARVAVNGMRQIAARKGLGTTDRVRSDYAPGAAYFLKSAANRLADTDSVEDFASWAERDLAERAARHGTAQNVWRAMADAAPGMGLIGTIAGLIDMFAHMDDPAKVGPGMALAMLTTFYGVVLANAFAGPIADRLDRLSVAELAWQRDAVDRLLELVRDEPPQPARQTLSMRHAA